MSRLQDEMETLRIILNPPREVLLEDFEPVPVPTGIKSFLRRAASSRACSSRSCTERDPAGGTAAWVGLASSDDGTKLVAGVSGGFVYTGQIVSLPTVTTSAVSNITDTTADSGGNVTRDGGDPFTTRGFCWNTTGTPTTADSTTSDGTGTGGFISNITGLTPNTRYFVVAYTTSSLGTTYGNELTFTTPSGGGGGGDGPSDGCPNDPNKSSPGVCGCGVADTDGDGTADCNDNCPGNPDKTEPGVNGCDAADTDSDGDGDTDTDGDDLPGETTVNEEGTAEVDNDTVDAAVEGFEEGTSIVLVTDDAGTTMLTATDSDGESVLTVRADGLGDGARIDVSIDESGNPSVTMTDADGTTLTVNASGFPTGIEICGARGDQDNVVVGVADDSGAVRNVFLETIGGGLDIVTNVIYNDSGPEAGQAVPASGPTVMGGGDRMANADSVTLEAVGLLRSAVIGVAPEYWEADYAGGDESELRLHRLNGETDLYLPAGTNDVGDASPTKTLGDYGVDTTAKTVWAQINELGTFAVGIPKRETLSETIDPDDTSGTPPACGAGGGNVRRVGNAMSAHDHPEHDGHATPKAVI